MTDARDDDGDKLPPELEELEMRLAERAARIVPPARLRGRVMAAIRRGPAPAAPKMNGWWQFAAAMAAAVLIGLNLAMAAAPSAARGNPPGRQDGSAARAARQLRELLPELSEREIEGLVATGISGTRVHGVASAPRGRASACDGL